MERGVCFRRAARPGTSAPASGALRDAAQAIEVPDPLRQRDRARRPRLDAHARRAASSAARSSSSTTAFRAREYYHPQRSMGTLMCHYRHRAHGDPFLEPGRQDITAHVDFSALARAAREAGLEVLGYATQAQFLVNCGITDVLARGERRERAALRADRRRRRRSSSRPRRWASCSRCSRSGAA